MKPAHCSMLKAWVRAFAVFAIASLPAFGQTPAVPPAVRSELAPTGKLHVGLPVTNPVAVTKDGPADEMRGVAVDLARAFAKRLGVDFEPVRYKSVTALFEGAKAGEWAWVAAYLNSTLQSTSLRPLRVVKAAAERKRWAL